MSSDRPYICPYTIGLLWKKRYCIEYTRARYRAVNSRIGSLAIISQGLFSVTPKSAICFLKVAFGMSAVDFSDTFRAMTVAYVSGRHQTRGRPTPATMRPIQNVHLHPRCTDMNPEISGPTKGPLAATNRKAATACPLATGPSYTSANKPATTVFGTAALKPARSLKMTRAVNEGAT